MHFRSFIHNVSSEARWLRHQNRVTSLSERPTTPPNRRQGYGPNEIVNEIFSYLDFRERARCASVCKQWHEIADDDLAYRRQYRLDILIRKMMWEHPPYSSFRNVCISCRRELFYQGEISRDMLDDWRTWGYRSRFPYRLVCTSCKKIVDRDLAYLRHWCPDMPGRTIMWDETPPKEGWKKFYIYDKILESDAVHNKYRSSMHKLEAYASRPVIPYHENNAWIEDRWRRVTNGDSWKVREILQGAMKWKPIPRLKLWMFAKSDEVSYDVEFELACRGILWSEWCVLLSWGEGEEVGETYWISLGSGDGNIAFQ